MRSRTAGTIPVFHSPSPSRRCFGLTIEEVSQPLPSQREEKYSHAGHTRSNRERLAYTVRIARAKRRPTNCLCRPGATIDFGQGQGTRLHSDPAIASPGKSGPVWRTSWTGQADCIWFRLQILAGKPLSGSGERMAAPSTGAIADYMPRELIMEPVVIGHSLILRLR